MSLPFAGGRLPSGVTQLISKLGGSFHLNGGGGFWNDSPSCNGFVAFAITALAGVVLAAAVLYNTRGRLKSPWSRRKRKHVLTLQTWRSMFTPDGKLKDGGIQFLKKVRSGGIDPSIRAEVWPFLLGIYELSSSKEERDVIKTEKRREYEKLRRQCRQISKDEGGGYSNSPDSEDVVSARESLSSEETNQQHDDYPDQASAVMLDEDANLKQTEDASVVYDTDSIDSDSSEDPDVSQTFPSTNLLSSEDSTSSKTEVQSRETHKSEDFSTWQRIIRLDAVRANAEWISYSPSQAAVEEDRAHRCAKAVGLKDYDHLEPCRVFHAARLVAILEAYALYDPEIGYCQGMSDLLSPLIAVMTEDYEAFWCFVGFMKKARHNFRLDEVGIRRQLKMVSKIIKYKDSHLYRHLEKLQAEDCFFVYRMVVVLFRRELTFEQTLCLWEVIWADQAAIRAGLGKSAWSKIRLRIPPTEDLLLYAIAASVLQRRKLIIQKYNSMDEILRECNSMAGHLDVWKLLDDAHNLVVSLHDKI